MKKKGFTLIELLAVIVILAIIALIATPLVLKYIEKSRKESKVDSAYSFVRNLETEIANFAIKNNGKKYTTDKESIKELGLDITVKGENPEDGKVCISSVGQVEKGVFQYGKYYVSYDGKKVSISDKDTYDNFSCSDNVAGDKQQTLLSQIVNFVYDEENERSVGSVEVEENEVINILAKKNYCLNIYNVNTNEKVIDNFCASSIQDGVASGYDEFDNSGGMIIQDNTLMILMMGRQIDGDFIVEIIEDEDGFIPYSLRIEYSGFNWLDSIDFVAGNAHVLITDENNTIYWDKDTTLSCSDGLCGVKSYDSVGLGDLDNVYNAIVEGKKINVKVTQTVDDKKVITVINGENVFCVKDVDTGECSQYVLGNKNFVHAN